VNNFITVKEDSILESVIEFDNIVSKDMPGIDIDDFISSVEDSIESWDSLPGIDKVMKVFYLLGYYKGIHERYIQCRKELEAICNKTKSRTPYVRVIGFNEESRIAFQILNQKIVEYNSTIEKLDSLMKALNFWKDVYKAKQFS